MSKIIIEHDDETGMIAIDGSDGQLSGIEILGILAMATNIIVQSDTKPVSLQEQVGIEVTAKQNKKRKYDA